MAPAPGPLDALAGFPLVIWLGMITVDQPETRRRLLMDIQTVAWRDWDFWDVELQRACWGMDAA